MTPDRNRICEISLDAIPARRNQHVDRERRSAISDLLDANYFELVGRDCKGPYRVSLSLSDGRLAFHIADLEGAPVISHVISARPLQRVIKDYWLICDAHIRASLGSNAYQLEAIDMGRRAFHNEGSQLLKERLASKISIDLETARGLFTLISTLLFGSRFVV